MTIAQLFGIGVLAVSAIVAGGHLRYLPEDAHASYRRIFRPRFHSEVMTRAA